MVTKETVAQLKVSRIKYTLSLPAGLRVRKIPNENMYWLDEFPSDLFPKNSFELHDASHYGVRLRPDQVTEEAVRGTGGKIESEWI